MIFTKKSPSYILDAFEKSKQWINDNTVNGGIIHSSSLRKPYPEVTGYYIPSLLRWGEKDLACSYGDWLLSIQTSEGAWQELELKTIYTFDTGQILKGLYELIPFGEKYEKAFIRGCDWLLSQIDETGKINTPTISGFSSIGNEYIHLYVLEPLRKAGEKYKRSDYLDGVNRALNYYIHKNDLIAFNILTHFHAYIVEALIDLGEITLAINALNLIKKYQRSSGAIPAFYNIRWVCLTAIMQYAVCYYKLGMLNEGNVLLDYAISKQNPSGGFYGGYGWFVAYFKNIEISWPIKYLLDALYLKLKLEFANDMRAEGFLASIDQNDERYTHLVSVLNKINVPVNSSVRLLDVGCGKGRFIHPLINNNMSVDVTAMDISDKLFHYLPKKCEKIIGNICSIPKEDGLYDIVLCCETLEHAVNVEAAIKELTRVCKLGGHVVIIDKDLERKKNIRLETWEQWFDKEKLRVLMLKNNLNVEIKELHTTDGPPICSWTGIKILDA
jgi:malonyl-CoA O-methyltransferase